MFKPSTLHQNKCTQPNAVQIVSIGNENSNDEIVFHEEKFQNILSKIPPQYKISVLSVVGATLSGNSFLLNRILSYLHVHHTTRSKTNGNALSHSKPSYYNFDNLDSNSGFHGREGEDRNTNGIWIWSEPFLMEKDVPENSSKKEPIALVLLDAQGMFDNGITMKLFGLSTLFSNIQIFNVVTQVQEDHFQQLALFADNRRVVSMKTNASAQKPFQRTEFLARDWKHFDADEDGNIEPLEDEMPAYIRKVIAKRNDLEPQGSHEYMKTSVDEISCFMITYPGFVTGSVVEDKNYDGDTNEENSKLLELLNSFCEKILNDKCLEPKKMNGRELTVTEFMNYAKEYVGLLKKGETFPEATVLLEATVNASIMNAMEESMKIYKNNMDSVVGPNVTALVSQSNLKKNHIKFHDLALKTFDCKVNFENKYAMNEWKLKLEEKINRALFYYCGLNCRRQPSLRK